jgi:integrase
VGIFKRGKIYWFNFKFSGKKVQRSTKQGNPRVARQIEAAHRTALAKEEVGITAPEMVLMPTFKSAMQNFLDWSKNEHVEHPATHRRYRVSSVALLLHFKDMPLDKITADEVECYKMERRKQFVTTRGTKGQRKKTRKRIKPATVNRELACLRAVFNHVIKSDVAVKNPVSKIGAKALQENNEQTRVLTYEEEERYLNVCTPFLRDVAVIMLETGMRPEEVYRIRPENVHLAGGYVFTPYGKTKAAKRNVPLNSTARTVLARRMNGLETPFLFPCDTDPKRPVPKVNNAHDRAVKLSGATPRFRLYDLRHTWATRAAQAGIDLVTLAALLGHSKIQMVTRYAHPTQDHQARSVERLERYVVEQRRLSEQQNDGTPQMLQ